MGRRPGRLRLAIEQSMDSGHWFRTTVPADQAKAVRNRAYQVAYSLGCGLETEIIPHESMEGICVVRIRVARRWAGAHPAD